MADRLGGNLVLAGRADPALAPLLTWLVGALVAGVLVVIGLVGDLPAILLIVLILILVGVIPSWPHSRGWGYGPSGGLGLVVLILVVLLLMGKI